MELGLTDMESRIYAFLLGESPATGYKISKAIGKPTANTYKSLESLEEKGVLLVEKGERKHYRAVPHEEMLDRFERKFLMLKQSAAEALATVDAPKWDDHVYHIHSSEQVYARFQTMLEQAEQFAIIDIFPGPLTRLQPVIEAGAARGLQIILKVYEETNIKGVRTVLKPHASRVRRKWKGQWINVVADSAELLLAFLSEDRKEVHQAVWTMSPFLSVLYQIGLLSEVTLDAIGTTLESGDDLEAVRDLIDDYQAQTNQPLKGYAALQSLME